jgi:hypothetical protein
LADIQAASVVTVVVGVQLADRTFEGSARSAPITINSGGFVGVPYVAP